MSLWLKLKGLISNGSMERSVPTVTISTKPAVLVLLLGQIARTTATNMEFAILRRESAVVTMGTAATVTSQNIDQVTVRNAYVPQQRPGVVSRHLPPVHDREESALVWGNVTDSAAFAVAEHRFLVKPVNLQAVPMIVPIMVAVLATSTS